VKGWISNDDNIVHRCEFVDTMENEKICSLGLSLKCSPRVLGEYLHTRNSMLSVTKRLKGDKVEDLEDLLSKNEISFESSCVFIGMKNMVERGRVDKRDLVFASVFVEMTDNMIATGCAYLFERGSKHGSRVGEKIGEK
jgi:hypothetical protein